MFRTGITLANSPTREGERGHVNSFTLQIRRLTDVNPRESATLEPLNGAPREGEKKKRKKVWQ